MFKVGDKVKIREDLEVGMCGSIYFIEKMEGYLGKTAKIIDIDEEGYFSLDVDNKKFYWSAEMLEYVKESTNEVLNDTKEADAIRLAKAVCEYERIVKELEEDISYMRNEHSNLIARYNTLVEKYNALLEELKEDYVI